MKVPYNEGLAPHIVPESCVYARKGIGEALTGGMRAGLLSCESFKIQGADVVHKSGRQHQWHRYGEMRLDPAWSENLCTYTSFSIGNQEVPRLALGDGPGGGAARSVCLAAHDSCGLKSQSTRGPGSISKSGGNASLAEVIELRRAGRSPRGEV